MLETPIVIKNFHRGTSQSPHTNDGAVAYSQGLDVTSELGVVKQANEFTKETGTLITGKVKWFVKDPESGNVYCVDTDHKIYGSANDGDAWELIPHASPSTGAGEGLVVWKDHLLLIGEALIDSYGPISGTPAWNDGWQALKTTSTGYNPAIHAQDDICYIGNGRYVASIQEVDGQDFDDATAGTFVFLENVLDLPEGHHIRTIDEHGLNLLLGTLRGGADSADITDSLTEAWIFPWDRNSSSFRLPAFAREQGVRAIRNIGGVIYAVLGNGGRVYQYSDGFLELVGVLPSTILDTNGLDRVDVPPQGIADHNSLPIIAYDTQAGSMPDGLYALIPSESGSAFNFELIISTGNISDVSIGAIFPVGPTLITGWQDSGDSSQGIDLLRTTMLGPNISTFFESLLEVRGTEKNPASAEEIELQFARADANQQVKVEWRKSLSDSWTLVGTYLAADIGDKNSHTITFPQLLSDKFQFKVTLFPAVSTSNVSLLSVTIK